jgi:hypothetical protein
MRCGGQHVRGRNLERGGEPRGNVGPRRFAERNLIGADEHGARGSALDDDGARVKAIADRVARRCRRGDIDAGGADAQRRRLRRPMDRDCRAVPRERERQRYCREQDARLNSSRRVGRGRAALRRSRSREETHTNRKRRGHLE